MVTKQHFKSKRQRIAGIFNFAPHYRLPIFQILGIRLNMDLYFGDRLLTSIKPLDYKKLSSFQRILPTRYFKRFYYNKGLTTLLLTNEYDVLLFTGEIKNLSLWVALLLKCIRPKLKVCLWTHGPYGNEKGLAKLASRLMYRAADHLFLYGNYAKQKLLTQGVSDSKISVVYNSLDYNRQLELRRQLIPSTNKAKHFNNSNPTLCYVGRIQQIKQIDLLILSVALLHEENHPVNLIIVGDGQQRQELELLVEELGLTSFVWFFGAIYDERVLGQVFYDADLCVSPGNVGLTAIHALSYGCPVITHNQFDQQMPEFEAITEGVTGAFFIKDDVRNLAKVICNWLENSSDPILREKIRNSCYAVVDSNYNPEVQVAVFTQAIDGLNAKNKHPR